MTDSARIFESQNPADFAGARPRLQNAARAIASSELILRPTSRSHLQNRLEVLTRDLARIQMHSPGTSAAPATELLHVERSLSSLDELRTNVRLLRGAIAAAESSTETIAQLPRVTVADGEDEPRIAAAARSYLDAVDGRFGKDTYSTFIDLLQIGEPLEFDELWASSPMLQFATLESLLHDANSLLNSSTDFASSHFSARIDSLRAIRETDWNLLLEPLTLLDLPLRQDPAKAYQKMDFATRQSYRRRVAFIASQSDCTECEVAQAALDLARDSAKQPIGNQRMQLRRSHVGFYLLDKGFSRIAHLIGFHPPLSWRIRQMLRASAEDVYIGASLIVCLVILAIVLFPVLSQFARIAPFVLAALTLLAPALQNASELINQLITALYAPEPLPKLDFSEGIPADCATLVVVPSLLLSEKQVRDLVDSLEVRFLANREPHLHFALLTDLPDSVSKPRDNDSHVLVDLAIELVNKLNAKYPLARDGSFLLLHRHRIFNKRQGVWMSWERKRGKLLDLNKLLIGEYDAFPIKTGRLEILSGIRYILTLDTDTQLPRGTAARLVGAIAHPLNQAVIDPKLRIVAAGYGILQPRIGVAVRSTSRSRLAAMFSMPSGFDIYSHAVSDAYQDLFGEASFTGKGIYEVATLHAVLNHRFPRNALLSHDLIEGAYGRAGLVSDIELIDDYPSHYSAYTRRQHRWVRGDWQVMQWLFSKVPDENGHWGPNPISAISRWKIFDNLLRSLIDPALAVLFVAGWLGLPGGPLYWTAAGLCLLFFPAIIQFLFGIGRAIVGKNTGQSREERAALGRSLLVRLLRLSLLLHQTWLTCDAILRSLVRSFITGKRLLEWETAAESELECAGRPAMDRYLTATCLSALALAITVRLLSPKPQAVLYAAPILLAWGLSSIVATWLNRPPGEEIHISSDDRQFLLESALCTWRFFCQFSAAHNDLIPDNVEENGLRQAPRVSPTNIGMLLNARQVAYEFGFLTLPEFAALTSGTLASIHRMEKFCGNLFNWYDTQTLQPLGPKFVSSADSANFVASLYTLQGGSNEMRHASLFQKSQMLGLRTHWRIMCKDEKLPARVRRLGLPPQSASFTEWIGWIHEAGNLLADAACEQTIADCDAWWLGETQRRISAIIGFVESHLPWGAPRYQPLLKRLCCTVDVKAEQVTLEGARIHAAFLLETVRGKLDELSASPSHAQLALELQNSLNVALHNLRNLYDSLLAIECDAEQFAEATEFSLFTRSDREVLSIGYDMEAHTIHGSTYDLFASEARLATFLAIVHGELPYQAWFKLEREHAYAAGYFVPFSWTGTMFEYLLPGLWMRSYRDTFSGRVELDCVHIQREFTDSMGIPWGISESGSARRNDSGDYSYYAYGIPKIALSPNATPGPVISPYSTFLALGTDTRHAINNLRRMDVAGWVGAFGFYEAADYTDSQRDPTLVRQWMAHHQGMSLLAIGNLLADHVVQRWFHANPTIQANELLLHELPISRAVLKARRKQLEMAINPKEIRWMLT